MTDPVSLAPNFLRDAFGAYAQYSSANKQDVQKRALKWLQLHINTDLEDKTIIEQFARTWRGIKSESSSSDRSPLHLEDLPGSYTGTKSYQEDALAFLQAAVPLQMQEDFKQRWDAKKKLEVFNKPGTAFKVDERDIELLQQDEPDGDGTTWYPIEDRSIYFLLSSEPKGDHHLVVLSEELGSQNRSTWFIVQEHVKITSV